VSALIFAGPTIGPAEIREILDARCLPPVLQGDVHRAVARYRPRAIGIVDGYFQHAPSVWHKEILWAMTEGVHVFGSASIGALRAAELAPYGMHGVGMIFEAYRRGVLEPFEEAFEDDDEVAVIHGPAEIGYVALCEAMVSIRCTLLRAEREGVIGRATTRSLAATAKGLFYQDRTYDALLGLAAGQPVPAAELAAFRRWLPAGRIDQKRDDARAMLLEIRELIDAAPGPMRVAFRLESTTMWERAVAADSLTPDEVQEDIEDLIDEARLESAGSFRELRRAALMRWLATAEADRRRISVTREQLRRQLNDLRREIGLARRAEIDRWLADNDLEAADMDRLIEDEARLTALERQLWPTIEPHLLDHLRIRDDYARIAARARAKRQAMADGPPVDQRHRIALLTWYFEERLRQPVPDDVAAYAGSLGFAEIGPFLQMLRREYAYLARAEGEMPPRGDRSGGS
jgi:hypothetical protein